MKTLITATSLLFVLSMAAGLQPLRAADEWIDVHFHVVGDKDEFDGFQQAANRVNKVMNRFDMGRVLIMSPPRPFQSFDIEELKYVQQENPSRIAIMGGGGTLNPMIQKYGHNKEIADNVRQKFEARAEEIIAQGAVGFGEVTAHHVSLNKGHGYESVPADHPLFLLLADIAAKHDVPIDIHFDPVPEDTNKPRQLDSPKNPDVFKENISGFERLLEHNRDARIVWAHAGSDPVGFYTPSLVRRLLKKHPNLYCSVRTTFKRNNPMRHPRHGINDAWIDVLEDFSDRFVMGTDSFVITPGYTGPKGPRKFAKRTRVQREGAVEVLAYLDADLRRKVGYENAVRIYRLDR